jgi:spermidine/putrescine transport system ATP-binding protein
LVWVEGRLPDPGSTVTIAVRPEKIAIHPVGAPADGDNMIEATLHETVYAGAVSTFILRTSNGSEIKVLNQNVEVPTLAPGTPVLATWPRGRTIVLEA